MNGPMILSILVLACSGCVDANESHAVDEPQIENVEAPQQMEKSWQADGLAQLEFQFALKGEYKIKFTTQDGATVLTELTSSNGLSCNDLAFGPSASTGGGSVTEETKCISKEPGQTLSVSIFGAAAGKIAILPLP